MSAAPNPMRDLLVYVTHGWPVFPVYEPCNGRCSCGDPKCASPAKHPRIKGWQQNASTDPTQIEAWATQFPGCNWGMPTGPTSGVDILDEDPRNGGDKTLAEFQAVNGTIPETVRVLTQSDGTHHLLNADPLHPVRNGTNVLGPGVDVRGDGGFVVIPPSVGVTGRAYRFDLSAHPDDIPIADWTEPLLRKVNGASSVSTSTIKERLDVPAVLAGVPEGERDESIWKLACKLRRTNVPEDDAVEVVLKAAARAVPPFPADRAEEKVHRAYRTYPTGSETIPPEAPKGYTDDQEVGLALAKASDAPRIREVSYVDLYALYTKPPEPIPWQLEGYMSRGESVTIGGEWGSGKSLTALDLAMSLAFDKMWMELVAIVGGPYRVLYLDEENGRALGEHRLRQLMKGRKLDPEVLRGRPILYTARNGILLSDPSWYDWLKRQIDDHEPAFLFLDALIRFCRVDENSNSQLAAFFGDVIQPLMNEYDLTVVALDQMGKPSKEKTDPGHRIRGGSEKPAANDELICMEGERGQDTRTITHEKTRWNKYQPALVTTCTESDDEESCWITAKVEAPEATDTVSRQILDSGLRGVLREDLVKTLSATAGKHASRNVSRALKTLKKECTIKSRSEGKRVRYWVAVAAPSDAA